MDAWESLNKEPPNNWENGLNRIKTLSQAVVVFAEDGTWLSCSWSEFEHDFAKPWIEHARPAIPPLSAGISGTDSGIQSEDIASPRSRDGRLLAVLLLLDARIESKTDPKRALHYRQDLWPAGIAKTLRLLRYHPRIATGQCRQRWGDVWKTPLAIFTWLSRDSVVSRRPDLTFLLAPSVGFFVPSELETVIWMLYKTATRSRGEKSLLWPQSASDYELERYFLADLSTDPADPHQLGNEIGPLIVARHLALDLRHVDSQSKSVSPEALPGIFFQQFLSTKALSTDPSRCEEPGSVQGLQDMCEELKNLLKQDKNRKVIIFDDDVFEKESGTPLWKLVWDGLLGPEGERWEDALREREGQELIKELAQPAISGETRKYLQDLCEKAYLLVIDLRLRGREKESEETGELSGHRLLREVSAAFEALGSPVPIIVFTSSQRQAYERLAYASGADLYVTKPTRFDLPGEPLRLLEGLCVYMDPAFRILGSLLSNLRKERQCREEGSKEASILDDLTAEMMLVRDTFANALESEREPRVPLKNSRDRRVRKSTETASSLGLIQEAYFRGSEEIDSCWRVIRHFRNLAAHPTGAELLRDEGAPRLGLALLFLAYKLVLRSAYGAPTGEYVERPPRFPGNANQRRLILAPWLSKDSEWLRQVTAPRVGEPSLLDSAVATFQCLLFLSNLPPDMRLPSYFDAALEKLKDECASRVSAEWTSHASAHDAWKMECQRTVATLSETVQRARATPAASGP